MRNELPSLHGLRAFDAAARLGAFNAAADELNVTPTAISHHIRALEDELGVKLFTRHTRKVELTAEGARLARVCAEAFSGLQDAVNELRMDRARKMVRIALGPLIASRWLMPRLPQFWEKFPDVDLNLLHSSKRINPRTIEADIYLVWGAENWPGMKTFPLLKVEAVPVASPKLLEETGPPNDAADLLRFPLIHQRNEMGWRDWLTNAGVDVVDPLGGMVIEDANVVQSAVLKGQGIALGWLPLIQHDVADGSLKTLFTNHVSKSQSYYLMVSDSNLKKKSISNIVDWLCAAAR